MPKRRFLVLLLLFLTGISAGAARPDRAARAALADTLCQRANRHFGVKSRLSISRADRGQIVFGRTLSDYPWRDGDVAWLRAEIAAEWPQYSKEPAPRAIYCRGVALEEYVMPAIGRDGKAVPYPDRRKGERSYTVRRSGAPVFSKGLSGRHIAIWHSHGYCYYEKSDRWNWQRAP
ncbi:MAG: hypothetical protein J5871_04175, partial [Bacteroidales bacterium]|nr:hypothetical protein [Bacteroidales bacterium]